MLLCSNAAGEHITKLMLINRTLVQTFNAPKPPLSLDNKGLQIAKTLETHFMKIDPSIEWFSEFKSKLSDCPSPHIFILKIWRKNCF